MSGEQDEAKAFLENFLAQLARSDKTNQDLLRVQLGIFQQNNQIIQALSTMSAQLDGMAQRSDYLYDQMGRLGQVIANDGHALTTDPFVPQVDSMARDLGRGVVDGFVKSFFPGQGRGGRSRRR